MFSLSPQLVEALRQHVRGKSPKDPLFTSREGKRLRPDNFAKRVLNPLRDKLGLKGGFHAMRHGNPTTLDQLNALMKVRQGRLGPIDPETAMGYTHLAPHQPQSAFTSQTRVIGLI